MRDKAYLILLAIFLVQATYSQHFIFQAKLLDANTKEPVVYANISFLKSERGIATKEDGSFRMYLENRLLNDSIHISCLNYKDTIVLAKSILNKTIYLSPSTEVLDEVLIKKQLNRTVVLDPVKNKVHSMHSKGLRMVAKYFPNTQLDDCCAYLSRISIQFPRRTNKASKFRFRIFSVDKKTGKPNKDLLKKNIPVEIKPDQTSVELDLSEYPIQMPENGFFVAFEKLFIPYNQYGTQGKDSLIDPFYSPIIGITKSRYYKTYSRNFIFVKGNWIELPYTQKGKMKGYVPAISVTLTN